MVAELNREPPVASLAAYQDLRRPSPTHSPSDQPAGLETGSIAPGMGRSNRLAHPPYVSIHAAADLKAPVCPGCRGTLIFSARHHTYAGGCGMNWVSCGMG